MEIHNFHTYKEKHKGSKPWEQKAVMKNKQENNRGEQEGAVYRLQTPTIIIMWLSYLKFQLSVLK